MILGLHHAQITIPSGTEQQAKDFYCEVLELKELPKPESLQGRGGFWLQVGTQEVHVGTEDGFDRNSTKGHLAYLVTDIQHWRNRLEEGSIEVLTGIPIPGYDRFEFRDPFGNRVEMIQKL